MPASPGRCRLGGRKISAHLIKPGIARHPASWHLVRFMSRILILYDTSDGQTEKIARHISRILEETGSEPRVENLRRLPPGLSIASYEGMILGASIHAGKHSRQATRFVRDNLATLTDLPSGFFSVSLSAAGSSQEQREHARQCLDAFLDQTNWQPDRTATFAGALLYRQYNWLLRRLMKWIAAKEGGDTDTSRDFEYTDWEQVDEFARSFSADLQRQA